MNMVIIHDKSFEYMKLIHDQVMDIRNRVGEVDASKILSLLLLEQDLMFTILQYQRLVHEINPDKLPMPTKAQFQSIVDLLEDEKNKCRDWPGGEP